MSEFPRPPILVRLAQLLNQKHLTLDSAFRLFDRNNNGEISIVDFKVIIFDALLFSNDLDEITELQTAVFRRKIVMNKKEFYCVFDGLLDYGDEVKRRDASFNSLVLDCKNKCSFQIIAPNKNRVALRNKQKELTLNSSRSQNKVGDRSNLKLSASYNFTGEKIMENSSKQQKIEVNVQIIIDCI